MHVFFKTSLFGALLVAALPVVGQPAWETVHNTTRDHGAYIGTDRTEAVIFTAGSTFTQDSPPAAMVRKSVDQGQSWSLPFGTFPGSEALDPPWLAAHYRAFASDDIGGLYAAGHLTTSPNYAFTDTDQIAWIVRESHDGGVSWTTDVPYQDASGLWTYCTDIKVAPSGDLYATGVSGPNRIVRRRARGQSSFQTIDTISTANEINWNHARSLAFAGNTVFVVGQPGWIVRRSLTGDRDTWTTVDSFGNNTVQSTAATDIAVAPSGEIYVVGAGYTQNRWVWIIRRSTDGGDTWRTIDQFTYDRKVTGSRGNTAPRALAIDSSGRLIVSGYTATAQAWHWLTRIGTPAAGSITWGIPSDDFQLARGFGAEAIDVTIDALDNIYVTGQARDESNISHWLIRKLAAP